MAVDYVEQILKATGIVVENYLSQLAFDCTENCTIVDISNKKDGKYGVSNGSMKFDAYVNTSNEKDKKIPEYKLNDSVRVSIPNGDYTQKKYIEGLSARDDTNPITYISPLENVLEITDNLISENSRSWGLCANNNQDENATLSQKKSKETIWSINLTDPEHRNIYGSNIFDTISLQADFKTLLSQYDIKSGNYGLELAMAFNDGSVKSVRLDSSEMFGNPYSFSIYSTQAIKFPIKATEVIDKMSLWFYQEGNFTFLNEQNILSSHIKVANDVTNLLVKNVYLTLGSDIINVEDNVLKLYTNDSLQFNDSDNLEVHGNDKELGILWYNKDENGKYLGFSDGIYDLKYDEIEYLKLSSADARLVAQQGRETPSDETGLKLSADIDDAQIILKKIFNTANRDLYSAIKYFKDNLSDIINEDSNEQLKEKFEKIMSLLSQTCAKDLEIRSNYKSLKATNLTKAEKLVLFYYNVLKDAREREKAYRRGKDPIKLNESDYNAYNIIPSNVTDSLEECIKHLGVFSEDSVYKNKTFTCDRNVTNEDERYKYKYVLTDSKTLTEYFKQSLEEYPSFQSLYDSFIIRITKLSKTLYDIIHDEYFDLLKDNHGKLTPYYRNNDDTKVFGEVYQSVDLSQYDNKYCIYWYRYDITSSEEDQFLGKNWVRLEKDRNNASLLNFGIPKGIGEKGHNLAKTSGDEGILKISLNPELRIEKYQVLVFYNHARYSSNIIEFENVKPEEPPKPTTRGALYIEHDSDSREVYQAYGVNNYLINAADAYKTRYLKVKYDDGTYQDEYLQDTQVFWYIPNSSTMLTYHMDDLPSSDFIKCDNSNKKHYKEGYTCFYRTIKDYKTQTVFPYRIKDYYVSTFSNNKIICKMIPQNAETGLETEILFTFNTYGTSGTEYSLVIAPYNSQPYAGYHKIDDTKGEKVDLILGVTLYDSNNKKIELSETEIEVGWVGPTYYTPVSLGIEDGVMKYRISPNRFSSQTNEYYGGPGIFKCSLKYSIPFGNDNETKTIILSALYPIAWSYYQNTKYYIEGPSTIVYNSQGNSPSYYKGSFKIFYDNNYKSGNIDIKKDSERTEDVYWEIRNYLDEDASWAYYDQIPDDQKSNFALSLNYVPKLKEDGTNFTPSNMYLDTSKASDYDLYPVVICWNSKDQTKRKAIWMQPLVIIQNKYPSAMLNQWDGEFKIDDKNGTIMSTMLGAGRKNNKNQFEGVLIGDIDANQATDVASGIGIYGYNEGVQSFRFGIDGKAFLGKSGKGRIIFDGNKGTIESQNYSKGTGLKIDLDDNYIDAKGKFRLTAGDSSKKADGYLALSSGGDYAISGSINGNNKTDWRIIAGDKFGIAGDGFVTASDADITGKITATEIDAKKGIIGDFTLENGALYTNSRTTVDSSYAGVHLSGKGISIISTGGTSYFIADVKNKEVKISGSIYASGGTIGGFNIDGEKGFNLLDSTNNKYAFLYPSGKGNAWTTAADGYVNLAFGLGTPKTINFGVTPQGKMYASEAVISGTVTATAGKIGGWNLADGILSSNGMYINGNTGIISASNTTYGTSFSLNGSGYLTAKGVDITGTITAEVGKLGNWVIKEGSLRGYNSNETKLTAFQTPGHNKAAIAVGATEGSAWSETAPFWVGHNGDMHAHSGQVGVWWIVNDDYGSWISSNYDEDSGIILDGIQLGIMNEVSGKKNFPVINISQGNLNIRGSQSALQVIDNADISFSRARLVAGDSAYKPYSTYDSININGIDLYIREGLICEKEE